MVAATQSSSAGFHWTPAAPKGRTTVRLPRTFQTGSDRRWCRSISSPSPTLASRPASLDRVQVGLDRVRTSHASTVARVLDNVHLLRTGRRSCDRGVRLLAGTGESSVLLEQGAGSAGAALRNGPRSLDGAPISPLKQAGPSRRRVRPVRPNGLACLGSKHDVVVPRQRLPETRRSRPLDASPAPDAKRRPCTGWDGDGDVARIPGP